MVQIPLKRSTAINIPMRVDGVVVVRFRSNVNIGQAKDTKMMKSWGFKASNMEKIMSVGPKKPDIDMKSKIKYKSNHTGRIVEQPLGMH